MAPPRLERAFPDAKIVKELAEQPQLRAEPQERQETSSCPQLLGRARNYKSSGLTEAAEMHICVRLAAASPKPLNPTHEHEEAELFATICKDTQGYAARYSNRHRCLLTGQLAVRSCR